MACPLPNKLKSSTPVNFPGCKGEQKCLPLFHRISEKPTSSLTIFLLTQRVLSLTSCPHQDVPHFHLVNGLMLCDGNTSTLAKSLTLPIPQSSTQNKPTSLMMRLNLPFGSQSHWEASKRPQIITLPSPCILKPLHLSSHNDRVSSCNITPI